MASGYGPVWGVVRPSLIWPRMGRRTTLPESSFKPLVCRFSGATLNTKLTRFNSGGMIYDHRIHSELVSMYTFMCVHTSVSRACVPSMIRMYEL